MDRGDYALVLSLAGAVYIMSGLVMLVRALLKRRLAWIGHVVPLLYVGVTFVYLAWLLFHDLSVVPGTGLFIWGQLVLGAWILAVLIQHIRRWDKLIEVIPELKEVVDGD